MIKQPIIEQLLANLAAGKIDPAAAAAALRKLAASAAPRASAFRLLQLLEAEADPAFEFLKTGLRLRCQQQALRVHNLRVGDQPVPDDCRQDLEGLSLDMPPGWETRTGKSRQLNTALAMLDDWLFSLEHRACAPALPEAIQAELLPLAQALNRSPAVWTIFPLEDALEAVVRVARSTMPALLPELDALRQAMRSVAAPAAAADETRTLQDLQTQFANAVTRATKEELLERVCAWPSDAAAPVLLQMAQEPWAQNVVALSLALRFGEAVWIPSRFAWQGWLERAAQPLSTLSNPAVERPGAYLILWALTRPDAVGDQLSDFLLAMEPKPDAAVQIEELVARWRRHLSDGEADALLALDADAARSVMRVPPKMALPPLPQAVCPPRPPPLPRTPRPASSPEPAPKPMPAAPPKPSAWDAYFKPFLVENWYIVVGLLMVLVGSSLLAFYTWDKSWLLRYTIMPALLALFTAGLAETGRRIERRDRSLQGTATMLRAAAVALMPLNFMTVALLSTDPAVPAPGLAVPLLVAVYALFGGWGLQRWCGAVDARLRWHLGLPLLLLNVLAAVRPLAGVWSGLPSAALQTTTTAGFYVGFAVLAAALVHFTTRLLTADLAVNRRMSWFFGAALAITFIEVFAWTHIWMQLLPPVAWYAPMLVLGGGLILLVERRILELRGTAELSSESFLGFALVLLGLLVGVANPHIRLVNFLLAGALWIYQGLPRKSIVDYWIGLTLLYLGGVSVGLLALFPGPWLPVLFIGLAVLPGLCAALFRSERLRTLRDAAFDFQVLALFIATPVTVLARWHYQARPGGTALGLTVIAALFLWRGFRDGKVRYVHVGMMVLALTLPYLGCVDLRTHTLRGNTMVFGLALLSCAWLAATRLRLPLLREARSSVLLVYGLVATAAMLLRVFIEGQFPLDPEWYRHVMDYTGPLLMTGVLLAATWTSRSLIPAALGALILMVLLPEMKHNLQATFPWLQFGSGAGTAVSAVLLTLVCFALRRAKVLQHVGPGDKFFQADAFPLSRPDHTMFTLPFLATILYLLLKIDTWVLLHNLPRVRLATAIALSLSGGTWLLVAAYLRRKSYASFLVYLGCGWVLAGLFFGHWACSAHPQWSWPVLAFVLLATAFYGFSRWVLDARLDWTRELFTVPFERLLCYGSLASAVCCMLLLMGGAPASDMLELELVLAMQLVWHCLAGGRFVHSSALFVMLWVNMLALAAPGRVHQPLWDRLTVAHSLLPSLLYLLAIQGVHLLLEWAPKLHAAARALWRPFMAAATALALAAGVWACADAWGPVDMTRLHLWVIIGLLLITARANGSPAFLLIAFGLGYLVLNGSVLPGTPVRLTPNLDVLLMPWRVSVLALALVLTAWALQRLCERAPRGVSGPFGFTALGGQPYPWLLPTGLLAACLSPALMTLVAKWRLDPLQLAAPFGAALAMALIAWLGRVGFIYVLSVVALTLGNIHVVRYFLADYLLAHGLSELHLMSLGVAASLLELTALRLGLLRSPAAAEQINRYGLVLAGVVLALIAVNFVSAPSLNDLTNLRLMISGAMALLAGWYFRVAARHPGPGEVRLVEVCEAFFHFGVSVFIWCVALLLPVLRRPQFTLLAFWLPGAWFWCRAEFLADRDPRFAARARTSAAIIGWAILALYAFRTGFNLTFYPDQPQHTDYYHYNSICVLLVGLMLFRLRGLGGTAWLAFYGGLALMVGGFFAITWFPGLSPFRDPVPAAWVAVLLAHFWIAASAQRSPLRTALLALGRIGGEEWISLRHAWGRVLLLAAHVPLACAILNTRTDPHLIAPLLAGGASILLHRALVNQASLYFILSEVELLAALHVDFVASSYLPKEHVVWVLLGAWAAAILAYDLWARRVARPWLDVFMTLLGSLTFVHVLWHGPESPVGLWAFALLGLLVLLSPRPGRLAVTPSEVLTAVFPLLVPAWLVFFSQPHAPPDPILGPVSWPACLLTLLTVYVTAGLGLLFQMLGAAVYGRMPRPQPRVADHTLNWLAVSGHTLFQVCLWLATVAAIGLQVLHYGRALAPVELGALVSLYALLMVGWHHEGKVQQAAWPYVFLQMCAVFLFAAIRRQLMLTTTFWTYEYDIWVSLTVSACLAGFQQPLAQQPGYVRRPFGVGLFLLPALALCWVLMYDLGTNLALIVVGLNSVLYTYLGRDDRESPYNVIGVGGFTAFVLLLLWSNLQVRVLFAFVVPTGLGVLVLVQLFARRLAPGVRQVVRGAALLAMFGSVAYSALLDSTYPVGFNLALIGLGLAAMACGTLLRLQLFLVVGACGVMVDLLSLLAKMVWHMDRSLQMTVIGVLILLVGTGLVAGTVYYKTHRQELNDTCVAWFTRFGDWE